MKRVLYVCPTSSMINDLLIPHIEMLMKKGYRVDCACVKDGQIDKHLLTKGIMVYDLTLTNKFISVGNIKSYYRLDDLQRINEYDIIHVHTEAPALLVRLLKLKFPKVKVVYTSHGYKFNKGRSLIFGAKYYLVEKLMSSFTDVIINTNKEDYEITKSKFNPPKSCVINGFGIDTNKFNKFSTDEALKIRRRLFIADNDFVVLMENPINNNRNVEIVKAIRLLKTKYNDIKVFVTGDIKKLQKLEKEIIKRDLQKSIVLLGEVNDLEPIINVCNVGLVLSEKESFNTDVYKYLAYGKKVIALENKISKDFIANDNCGVLISYGKTKELVSAIKKVYIKKDVEVSLTDEITKYNVENIVESLWGIYKELEVSESISQAVALYFANK